MAYECEYCGEEFDSKQALGGHVRLGHTQEEKQSQQDSITKEYKAKIEGLEQKMENIKLKQEKTQELIKQVINILNRGEKPEKTETGKETEEEQFIDYDRVFDQ